MKLNEEIVKSPVTLFLGAGASVPLGKPSMEDFVTNLERLIPSYSEYRNLFSQISHFRGKDLEAILSDLENLLNLHYIDSFNCRLKAIPEANDRDEDVFLEISNAAASELRSFIRHQIIKEYRELDSEKVVRVYEPLFESIFSLLGQHKLVLPVFTTNYDLAIETFCKEKFLEYYLINGLEPDGFENEYVWNPLMIEPLNQGYGKKRQIVLFKLHGSIDWIRSKTNNRIVKAQPMYDLLDSDVFQNVLIYPAGDKMAVDEPFLTNYRYFSRCCEHTKLLIVIGYSFRDYGTVSALINAFELNDDFFMILISPNANTILESIQHEDKMIFTTPIFTRFGDAEDEKEYLNEIRFWINSRLHKDK